MKIALVAHIIPPMWSGNPVVLQRIFSGFDPSSYCVISRMRPETVPSAHVAMAALPGRHYHVTPGLPLMHRRLLGSGALREHVSIRLGILLRARRIASIVRREKCDVIIACTGGEDLLDIPAAYFASRMTGARFYPWMFDHYEQQWEHAEHCWKLSRTWSYVRRLIARIMRGATAVICPNEFIAALSREKYGARTEIVRNPCDLSAYAEPVMQPPAADELRIVFTGAVYEAHFDAFRDLLRALELPGARARIHLYTALSPQSLAAHGIEGPIVFHRHLAVEDVPQAQRSADVLFLPLAFESAYPELVRTSSPGKFGEYLGAGRPILAHVPGDSFVADYLQRNDAGVVVADRDPASLRSAVDALAKDPVLAHRLAGNAWKCAMQDFEVGNVREHFKRIVGI